LQPRIAGSSDARARQWPTTTQKNGQTDGHGHRHPVKPRFCGGGGLKIASLYREAPENTEFSSPE